MEEKEFKVGGASAWTTLIVLSLLWMINFADRSIMTIAMQPIKEAFNLSDTQVGLLPTLLTVGIAILTIPGAIFSDRWARRKLIAIMATVWSLFTLVTGFCTHLWQMLICRFMVGSGEAGYAPAGLSWLSVSFEKEKRGLITGIFTMSNQLGAVIGLLLGGWLITATSNWRTPFYVFAIPGIILAVIVLFLPDYKTVKKSGEALVSKEYLREIGSLFKIKSYWYSLLFGTFFYFMVFARESWFPTLITRAYDMSSLQVGVLYLWVLPAVAASPIGSHLADKWQKHSKKGRAYYLVAATVIAFVTQLPLFFMVGIALPVFVTLWFIANFCCFLAPATTLAVINDITPLSMRSTSIGIANLIFQLLGASLGAFFTGVLSDFYGGGVHGLQWALITVLPAVLVSVLAAILMTKPYPADSDAVIDKVLAEK